MGRQLGSLTLEALGDAHCGGKLVQRGLHLGVVLRHVDLPKLPPLRFGVNEGYPLSGIPLPLQGGVEGYGRMNCG